MATNRVEIPTKASPEAAWDAVRDVGALHTRLVPGFVVDTRLEPGARVVTFANGMTVREPIIAIDETLRRLVWSATGGMTTHYNASAQVVHAHGHTKVIWTADFLPDEAATTIQALMARGADVMRDTLDRLADGQAAEPAADRSVEASFARDGKLSYLQIPATDVEASARFYASAFGWSIGGSASHRSFKDASGDLLGAFLPGREIAHEAGLLPYIYVDAVDAAVARIQAAGGAIQSPPYAEGPLRVATFRDPAGNLLGIWTSGPR